MFTRRGVTGTCPETCDLQIPEAFTPAVKVSEAQTAGQTHILLKSVCCVEEVAVEVGSRLHPEVHESGPVPVEPRHAGILLRTQCVPKPPSIYKNAYFEARNVQAI